MALTPGDDRAAAATGMPAKKERFLAGLISQHQLTEVGMPHPQDDIVTEHDSVDDVRPGDGAAVSPAASAA